MKQIVRFECRRFVFGRGHLDVTCIFACLSGTIKFITLLAQSRSPAYGYFVHLHHASQNGFIHLSLWLCDKQL